MPRKNTPKQLIRDERDIPAFGSEAEEAAFWANHSPSPELMLRAEPIPPDELPPPRPRVRLVSLRLADDIVRRLEAVAAKKGVGYQDLLEEFIVERLSQEE